MEQASNISQITSKGAVKRKKLNKTEIRHYIYLDGVNVTPKQFTSSVSLQQNKSSAAQTISAGFHSFLSCSNFPQSSNKQSNLQAQIQSQTRLTYDRTSMSTTTIQQSTMENTLIDIKVPVDPNNPIMALSVNPVFGDDEDTVSHHKGSIDITDEMYPKTINVCLKETHTIDFFELPSISEDTNSKEGAEVTKDNSYYEYMTVGKGRNRKMVAAEAQTINLIPQTKYTSRELPHRRSNLAYVSNWDYYDTIKETCSEELCANISVVLDEGTKPLDEVEKIFAMSEFKDAVTIMERVLTSNEITDKHKTFKGLISQDPFRDNVEYNYKLNLLWTLKCEDVNGRTVTMFNISPRNPDLLVVSYGKFYFSEKSDGVVCVWNIKNILYPERIYKFQTPVSCAKFSSQNPNLIAVTFHDGNLQILDVYSRETKVILSNQSILKNSTLPIWICYWVSTKSIVSDDFEVLITCGQDGCVNRYLVTKKTLEWAPLIQLVNLSGRIKGVSNRGEDESIKLSPQAPALNGCGDPQIEFFYYITTEHGCVFKCCKHHMNYVDAFFAHHGPVYSMQFSPFWHKIFLTCGADYTIRIWAAEMYEPLLTLMVPLQCVQFARWSPSHATIIASIAGTELSLWDFGRRTYEPVCKLTSPTGSRYTHVNFTSNGQTLIASDIDGAVFYYNLTDMPFPAFNQRKWLESVLAKTIQCKQNLFRKFKKHCLYLN